MILECKKYLQILYQNFLCKDDSDTNILEHDEQIT